MLIDKWVAAIAATLTFVVSGWSGASFLGSPTLPSEASTPAAPTPHSTIETSTTSTTIPAPVSVPPTTVAEVFTLDTTTTTLPGIDNARCPRWWPVAVAVGWPIDDLSTLDLVMWNESRCDPTVVSSTRDYGLVQVNRKTWQATMRDHGWEMDDLLDPAIGLAAGLIVADAASSLGWCRWEPWYMSGQYCR